MNRVMLSDCQEPLTGELVGDDVQLTSFSIDTRTLQKGDLYIAIKGERFDGHDYCHDAAQKGAIALLVHKPIDIDVPQLIVPETRYALAQLGKLWADGYQLPTVAITGSNGKTTVKEMIAAILGQLGPVLATSGNLNNDIGVPLTLLKMRSHHQYAVIEMGANHVGEIAMLSKLVRPDVAVVNNVGPAHLEGFGSIEAVAQAKSEIYAGLGADGCAVINADDSFSDVMRAASTHCRLREFGSSEGLAVQLLPGPELTIATVGKTLSPRFSLLGYHNRLNAVAATATAQCMDVQPVAIMAGLASVQPVQGRLQMKPGKRGSRLIDDTYNANPVSVKAAIDVLADFDGERVLVLGDMAELGDDAVELHAAVGRYAQKRGIDALLSVGSLSMAAADAFNGGRHHTGKQALVEALGKMISSKSTVLVKGSRGSRMEQVVMALVDKDATASKSEAFAAESPEAISL